MPARENSVTWFNLEGEELRTLEYFKLNLSGAFSACEINAPAGFHYYHSFSRSSRRHY